MPGSPTARGRSTRVLSLLVVLGLALGISGLTAGTAQAAAVTNATASQTGPGKVTVTWDYPQDDARWFMTILSGPAGYHETEHLGGVRSATFTGVSAGDYQVHVYTATGDCYCEITTTSVTVTSAPVTAPTELFLSPGDGMLYFQEPVEPGADPDHYTVKITAYDNPTSTDGTVIRELNQPYSPGEQAISLGDVDVYKSYAVSVALVDGADLAGPSADIRTRPWPPYATGVNAAEDNGDVTVNWDYDQTDIYADSIDVFLVNVDTDESVAEKTVGPDVRTTTFADLDLPRGSYYAYVTTSNTDGGNANSGAPFLVGDPTTAPQDVTASSHAANKAAVTWVAPADDGGFPVYEYKITITTPAGDYVRYADADERSVSFGYVPAGTFDVSVVTYNEVGESAAGTTTVTVADPVVVTPPVTPSVVVTPPVTPPANVTPPVVTPTSKSLRPVRGLRHGPVTRGKHDPFGHVSLFWDAPKALSGARVLRYVIHVDGRRKVASASHTSTSVQGLRRGPVTATVRAEYENGASTSATIKFAVAKAVSQGTRRTLRTGMDSAAIGHLQAVLGVTSPGTKFDARTRTAVLTWQRAHHLARTGEVNDRMRYLLRV